MLINWGLLLPAFILLAYPLDRVLPARMKCRSYDNLVDPAFRHRRRWWRWQPELWLDAVRIGVAAWFLKFSIEAETSVGAKLAILTLGALLVIGLGMQMITRRKEDTLLAPLGYVIAVTFVFLPPLAALSVFAMAVVALGAIQDLNAYFVGGAAAAAAMGYMFAGSITTTAMLAGVFFLPVMFGMLSGRKLLIAVRSAPHGEKIPTTLR